MLLLFMAAVLTLITTGAMLRAAPHIGLVDPPDARKCHGQRMPLAGGPGIFLAWSVLGWSLAPAVMDPWLYAGAAVVFGGGLVDDWGKARQRPMPARVKLAVQTASAILVVLGGTWIRYARVPFSAGLVILPAWGGMPLAVLWLVAITNFVNFLDGMDGLMGCVAGVAAATLLAAGLLLPATTVEPLLWLLLGCLMGFLCFNLPPARLFAGDSGSNFIGFLLAALSLQGYLKTVTAASLAVSVLALSLFFAEGLLSILRRWLAGQPITAADHAHTFHRLGARGYSPVRILWLFSVLAAALSGAGLLLIRFMPW